jgi:Rrf2 family protein
MLLDPPVTLLPRSLRSSGALRVSARADYGVRAAIELAVAYEAGLATKGEAIGRAQSIPVRFLENILADLRQSGLVRSQRGADGGYWLAKPPADIAVADVIRAIDGPLASVRGQPPEDVGYSGTAAPLLDVWIAMRAAVREVVENVTLADLAADELPASVRRLAASPGAGQRRQ